MKILYLAHRLPYPPNKGDKIRSHHMLAHLAKRHDVWCACFVDDPSDLAYVATVRSMCREVIAVPLRRGPAMLRGLLDLAIDEPATEGFYRSRAMAAELERLRRRVRFDTVLAYSSCMGQYARCVDAQRRVIDFCDLDSRKWASMARQGWGPRCWMLAAEARRLGELERQLHGAFDASILIGPHEVQGWAIRDRSKLYFVGNGVCLPDVPRGMPSGDPTVGFVGDMGYHPNEDGVCWFVREAWPAIRSVTPSARFRIIGRNPSRRLRRLEAVAGVDVVGPVEDVAEHLRQLSVVVAPLRIARGIQNKVLEALAAGRPTVVTPQAAAGLQIEHGRHALIGGDADALAAHTNRLIREPTLAVDLAERGRNLVATAYTWPQQLAPLDDILSADRRNAALRSASAAISLSAR